MANEFVKATKVGELGKIKGYDGYGVLRLRHEFDNKDDAGPPLVPAEFSDAFIELPTIPEMIKITATTEVQLVFANQPDQVKETAVDEDDIKELEKEGIDNIGLNQRTAIIVVPAGEEAVYRKKHEKLIAFKGEGVFEAW